LNFNTIKDTDQKHIWHPFTRLPSAIDNIVIDSAKGVYLYDNGGKKYIDAVSSWWVNIHGHGNKILRRALNKQFKKIDHIMFAGFTHQAASDFTSLLLEATNDRYQKIFFSDNGSTSVEVAVKMALQYHHNQRKHDLSERLKVVAFTGSYHGDTFGAMSVGDRGLFTRPFHKLFFDVEYIDLNDRDNSGETLEKFTSMVSKPDIGAFIFEPLVQGAGGMNLYSAELLNTMVRIARKNGVVTIADEVMTGFGRTGTLFATDQIDEKPDILCLSKGITGGVLPLGVTLTSENIFNTFKSPEPEIRDNTFYHGHSYTANPLTLAVAEASLKLLLKNWGRVEQLSQWQGEFARHLKQNKRVENVRNLGTITAFEVISDDRRSYTHPLREVLYKGFLAQGVLLRPLGNTIYVMPPYVITYKELEKVYQAIETVLETIG